MPSMSNQLCTHLKQLAMVTKKAALNFPDKLALQEVQDIAKELAQKAQQFRMSLDVWAAVCHLFAQFIVWRWSGEDNMVFVKYLHLCDCAWV